MHILVLKVYEKELNEHIIRIYPENLALTYVSNSTIVKYFEDIGVNLDPFYNLLWRHVLTVELLKKYVDTTKEKKKK